MKLKAKHDDLISQFLRDTRYQVNPDGTILRKNKVLGFTKATELKLRNKQYKYIKYKGYELKVHRIIYTAFHGPLCPDKVVHHIDGNGLNNDVGNLSLETQSVNCYYRQKEA